ncbi:MAG TPA: universal stress protein [Puia sp.]|nr:universal stress protein [Puia sp.]
MKSIVVPVNYTPNSANAARYAADLALSIGADIHLFHTFQVPMSIAEVPMPEPVFDELQNNGLDLLKNLSAELVNRGSGRIRVSTEMQIGTVESALEQFCKEKEPLLVVMGATGGGLENALLGSNTVRAVRHLPYPILVVPEDAHFQPIKNVVVACDREDLFLGLPVATPVLRELSGLPDVRLEVVHVITGEESASEFTEAYNRWKGQVKGMQPELHFVRGAGVEEGLTEHLRGRPADLVLVFPKRHGLLEFHRSHARRLVLHCAVPVMSLHE